VGFSLAVVVATTLLPAIAGIAPVPKNQSKLSANEIEVTPATDDKELMAKNEEVSKKHIKNLALAVIDHADVFGEMPRDTLDKNGKKLLSWRVQILPYLEEGNLYNQFKLDEPWDSESNLKLIEKMPESFASPRVSVKSAGFTVFQGFAGKGSLFEPGKKQSYPASITDGTSQTIMVTESSIAVPWTKPADLPFDIDKELPDFGKAYGARPLAAMCDGSVRFVDTKKVSSKTLKSAITTSAGDILGADWDEK
jgi:hypothetical protein